MACESEEAAYQSKLTEAATVRVEANELQAEATAKQTQADAKDIQADLLEGEAFALYLFWQECLNPPP